MPRKKTTNTSATQNIVQIKQTHVAGVVNDSLDLYRSELLHALNASEITFTDEQKTLLSTTAIKVLSGVRGKALNQVIKLYK